MDSRITRLRHRYKGLSRVAAAINDLYIYGVYPQNFPYLTDQLEKSKDLVKIELTNVKKEMEILEGIILDDEEPTDPLRT